MADLYIDMAALRRTRADLERITDLVRGPVATMAEEAGAATEHRLLRERLASFGDAWEHGTKKLGEYASGVGEAMTQIESTFADVEAQLAATFDDAGGAGAPGGAR